MMMIPTPRSKVLLALCATQLVTLLYAAQETSKASCCSEIRECFSQDPGKLTRDYYQLGLPKGTKVTNVRMIPERESVEFVTDGQTYEIPESDWYHFELLDQDAAKYRRNRYMFNNRHFLGDGSGMWQGQRLSYASPKTYNDVLKADERVKILEDLGNLKKDAIVRVAEIGGNGIDVRTPDGAVQKNVPRSKLRKIHGYLEGDEVKVYTPDGTKMAIVKKDDRFSGSRMINTKEITLFLDDKVVKVRADGLGSSIRVPKPDASVSQIPINPCYPSIREKISDVKKHLRGVRITNELQKQFMTFYRERANAYSVWARNHKDRAVRLLLRDAQEKWMKTPQYKDFEEKLKHLVEKACAENGIDLNFKGYTYKANVMQRNEESILWHNDNIECGMIIYLNNSTDGPSGTMFSSDLDDNFSVQMCGEVGTGVLWNDRMLIHTGPVSTDTTRTFLRVSFNALRRNGPQDFGRVRPSKHRCHHNVDGVSITGKSLQCEDTVAVLKQECDAWQTWQEMENPLGLEWAATESCSIQ